MADHPLANYGDVYKNLIELVDSNQQKRIVLLKGDKGYGKSFLLSNVIKQLRENKNVVVISHNLNNDYTKSYTFLNKIASSIGNEKMKHYSDVFIREASIPFNAVSDNRLIGIGNELKVIYDQKISSTPILPDLSTITESLFFDINTNKKIIVIILDDYNNSKNRDQLLDWFENDFLWRVSKNNLVRIIIAGEKPNLPNPTLDWENCCIEHELSGVFSVDEWKKVLDYLNKDVETKEINGFLYGLIIAFHGCPNDIVNILYGLKPGINL